MVSHAMSQLLAHVISATSYGPCAYALNVAGSLALTALWRRTTGRSAARYLAGDRP